MIRTFARLGAAALVALALSGCGGGGGAAGIVPAPPAPTDGRSVASGYVYAPDDGRAAVPAGAPQRLTLVRDRLNQAGLRPLANATISMRNRVGTWLTNHEGYFEIPDVPEGEVDLTVVPPPDLGLSPASFGIVAGPRHHGNPPPRPPIDPSDGLFVLPPVAAVQVGDVVQFYAMVLGDSGPEDITDQVSWVLRPRAHGGPVGELTAGGVFTAQNPGEAMVVALPPGDDGTRQLELLPDDFDVPAPGDAQVHGAAFVEVLPQFTAVKGTVISSNDQPVRGAFVFATGIPHFAVTEYTGQFFIPLVPPDEPIELTVIYGGEVVGTTNVTVAAGQIEEVRIVANVEVDPPLARPVHALGLIERPEATTWQYGTHVLRGDLILPPGPMPLPMGQPRAEDDGTGTDTSLVPPEPGPIVFALQSGTLDLNQYLGAFVEVIGTRVEGYPVEGGPPLLEVTRIHPLATAAAEAGAMAPRPPGMMNGLGPR